MRIHTFLCALLLLPSATFADFSKTFAVNEYFGVKYKHEPVSFDVDFAQPVAASDIALDKGPCQVEVLEGTPAAVRKARVWTLVDFDAVGQQLFTVKAPAGPGKPGSSFAVSDAGEQAGIRLQTIGNGRIFVKVPVGSAEYPDGRSAFDVPGPVVSISTDGKTWYGSGYLDCMPRVKSVRCDVESGEVFWQSKITYGFDNGKTYTAAVRLYPGKGHVQLVEDFNVGGAAKFIFNYDDWTPPWVVSCGDQAQTKLFSAATYDSNDFVKEEGQRCLVRLVVWTQFGYFGGKSETIGLCNEDGSLAVGGFYIRPDRWTRAKVNHVDLYERPEVPGDRMTRGIVGLKGAKKRYAMEAWLVDGHREWAIYAMPAGAVTPDEKGGPPKVEWTALRKAHVVEGVWPLDRINRMPLVWNADGSPVKPEDTAPTGGEMPFGGDINTVLKGMQGRSGLQHFNGSNGSMRGGYVNAAGKQKAWALANADKLNAAALQQSKQIGMMVGPAMAAYMAMDESAYPGRRAMLPWTDPEALNPFYQGMENMNFNADRYNSVSAVGAALVAMKHPEGQKILRHGEEQMSMALDRYVYPQSGTWEESHSYAQHTLKNLIPLANNLKANGVGDYWDDLRFARIFEWWCVTASPRDPGFGNIRIQPPVGDHGLSVESPVGVAKPALPNLAASKNPEVRKIASHLAWLFKEKGQDPGGVDPVAPNNGSQYVQGYGAQMRAVDTAGRETYVLVRAEQAWGHHHMDKGSLWGWFRNVHFFGDAAWGGPPGPTYGNHYKQGPASGTQIELIGVTNWTLPCKYAAPWISDDQYDKAFDYVNARCMYPFNPKLDVSKSTPVTTRNGYDRQVLLVHPDLLIVRDNVETVCPTVWRMHSYQVDGLKVAGGTATMPSPQGVTGQLNILYPAGGVELKVIDRDDLNGTNAPFGSKPGDGEGKSKSAYDTRSVVLKWEMPMNTSATWVFSASGQGEAPAKARLLDNEGRVTSVTLADGREIIAFMSIEPFKAAVDGIDFDGTVGLVIRQNGKATAYPVRANALTVK